MKSTPEQMQGLRRNLSLVPKEHLLPRRARSGRGQDRSLQREGESDPHERQRIQPAHKKSTLAEALGVFGARSVVSCAGLYAVLPRGVLAEGTAHRKQSQSGLASLLTAGPRPGDWGSCCRNWVGDGARTRNNRFHRFQSPWRHRLKRSTLCSLAGITHSRGVDERARAWLGGTLGRRRIY